MRERYAHQDLAIDLLRQALRSGKKRPMLDLATAAGKTKISADIFHMARSKGKRCLFVCDQINLIDQTVNAFWQEGHRDIGVIQADHPLTDYSKPIQVASVQTLARRAWPEFDICVNDEAHILYATHIEMMEKFPDVPIIGLSGTPWSKGLGLHYDCLIKPVTMSELMDMGRILPLVAYAPSNPDLSNVKVKAGEYDDDDLSAVMQGEKLVADAVETWKALGEGRPTLCYCVDLAHAKTMQERFQRAGVPCGYIDGKTLAADRRVQQSRLESGELKVVVSVGTMIKGSDWLVSCGIDCQPTKSHSRHVQKCGRVIRVRTGAEHGLWLDHAGNCLRLGMPVDIVRTELCTLKKGERKEAEAQAKSLPKPCPSCGKLKTAKICACGFESQRESDLSEGVGQLARIDGKKAGPKKSLPTPDEKLRFYRELKGYAALKGKGDKFPDALFRARYGEWPHPKNGVQPITPSPETLSYIKARNIAWAKSQNRRAG